MSAPMKAPRTKNDVEIVAAGRRYCVPKPTAKAVLTLIANYLVEVDNSKTVSAEEVFREINARAGGKSASILRGLRGKHGLTQVEMAEKLGYPQSHISAMENGSRPIGKKVIAQVCTVFGISPRVFT